VIGYRNHGCFWDHGVGCWVARPFILGDARAYRASVVDNPSGWTTSRTTSHLDLACNKRNLIVMQLLHYFVHRPIHRC
jgi:hypothetical protein